MINIIFIYVRMMFRTKIDLKMYVVTSLYAVDTVGTGVNKC